MKAKKKLNKCLHRKLKGFCPRHNVKANKKAQTSSSAQMQTIVKLLLGILQYLVTMDADVDHTQIIGGDVVKLLGGYIPPTLPGLGTPGFVDTNNSRILQKKILFFDYCTNLVLNC